MTFKVAQLSHLLVTNFALEDVGIHTASLLADVVLSDAVAHDIAG